ncbi:MAG: hypothetical protein V1881_02035 [Candidatus Micrarchaeota archaeon]
MEYKMKRHTTNTRREGTDKWLSTYAKRVALELVLSAVFFTLGHIIDNAYVRGVGIGLVIAWVTGALAYFVVRRKA